MNKVQFLWKLTCVVVVCWCFLEIWRWHYDSSPNVSSEVTTLRVENPTIPTTITFHDFLLDNFQFSEEDWELFQRKGISQLSQCGDLNALPELPAADEKRVQAAAALLRQRLILRQWLASHYLDYTCYQPLLANNVTSLEDIYWLEDTQAKSIFSVHINVLPDFLNRWSKARQSLPTSKAALDALKSDLWSTVVKLSTTGGGQHLMYIKEAAVAAVTAAADNSDPDDVWTWGGMLVVTLSVAGLVTFAAMTQPSIAPDAKHALLQYVTGKYLLPANSKVTFEWTNPQQVGTTVCFTVRFYQRNGNSYPISDADNFHVDVLEGVRKIAVIIELGSDTDPDSSNLARVKFTVRHAARYAIHVMVGSQHVAGSPFTKTFVPRPPVAQRTLLQRQCATVVCTALQVHPLQIEPRDDYDNLCCFTGDVATNIATEPCRHYEIIVHSLPDLRPVSTLNCIRKMSYDRGTLHINVVFKFLQAGCYTVRIQYCGTTIKNGDFDVIVLTHSESIQIHRDIVAKTPYICHEARLVLNGTTKTKKVLCCISPKQLIVKELFLKFIPKRLYTFRLCPSTKIDFRLADDYSSVGIDIANEFFTIDDGCQSRIGLLSTERNVIAATFTEFLLKNIGGSETFNDKRDYFYHEVRKYHQRHNHDKIPLRIQREKLLESSCKATKHFSVSDWCRNFEITFNSEAGVDWGGIRREWFELICTQLFDGRNGLFTSFQLADNETENRQQQLVHPNPNRPTHFKLKHFEFAGRIVGKCLYESALGSSYRQLVKARFTRSFLAQIIGLRVHYKYFEQDDPDLYLTKIKYLLENDIDDIDTELYFTEEVYDSGTGQLIRTIDLIPNGSHLKVLNTTKLQYLDALAQYRLSTCARDETEAFLKGLNELIPDNLLSIFDENELELLLCGTGQYSIIDFKQHHLVNGNSMEFRRIVGWFWGAVENFTQEEMARLLQFTTGCSQLPPGGFKELVPKLQLMAAPTFGNLPTAHTCFNQLCLPDYDSYEQFERALLLAISEGSEGFGMV